MNIQFLISTLLAITTCNELSTAVPLVPTSHRGRSPFASSAPSANEHLYSNHVNSPRLSVVEWDQYNERNVQGPDTYAFGYDVQDPETDNTQFRHEERLPNGTVVGSYGFVTPDGNAHVVKYIADHLGYRATVETNRRLADVKPIPVNVEQALADEIASPGMSLQNEKNFVEDFGSGVPVASYDSERKKYTAHGRRPNPTKNQQRFSIDNKKEMTYQVLRNVASGVPYQVDTIRVPSIRQPNAPGSRHNYNLFDIYPF